MQRNFLKVGDKSTAGGTAVEGVPSWTHHGTELTFVGAQVICPVCNTTGHIVPKGPRWPWNMMGKDVALEGDLCACRCYPPPTMLSSQSTMFQSFEGHHVTDQGFTSSRLPLTPGPLSRFDERVRVLDGNGRPLSGVPFRIETEAGVIHKGLTDADGYCPRVYTTDSQNLDIAIGYKAVERWNA
ncbi:PAAR domain-containing protein [Burkholderia sp. LMG 32019]|uniref:PAAR domain-containing protein n=1 Tax=Burkholderia sp. LMG 32019 TaxID=3158173 RepID=UPI003C2F00D7